MLHRVSMVGFRNINQNFKLNIYVYSKALGHLSIGTILPPPLRKRAMLHQAAALVNENSSHSGKEQGFQLKKYITPLRS